MNHRWNVRLPIRLNVEICHAKNSGKSVYACSRDISTMGMYLELTAAGIPVNSFITSCILQQPGIEARPIELPAVITHSDCGGIGMMFVDLDSSDYNQLIEFVHAVGTDRLLINF